MRAFITGSRAYGVPREDSDLDLVVLLSTEDGNTIWKLSEEGPAVRFGMLNLIVYPDCDSEREKFRKWFEVTEELKRRSPVTREEAIKALQAEGIGGDDYLR